MPSTDFDLRALVLDAALAHLGQLETVGKNNYGEIVKLALRGAVRGGHPLGIPEGVAWCAAFAGACLFDGEPDPLAAALAWTPSAYAAGDVAQPVGWRAAVWEIVADARATGTFLEQQAATEPLPGDLVICGRNGQDPRRPGNEGHATILREVLDGAFRCIGGNEADPTGRAPDGVRLSLRRWGDAREPVVGIVRVEPSAAFLARAAAAAVQQE